MSRRRLAAVPSRPPTPPERGTSLPPTRVWATLARVRVPPRQPPGWLAALGLLASLGAGCQSSAEVIVEVHTDLEPGVEFDAALAEVGAARASDRSRSGAFLGAGVRLPALVVPPGPVELRAALELGGRTVVARSLAVRAQGSVVVPVWLVRGCVDLICPSGGAPETWTECDGGRCVAPDCVPTDVVECAPSACDVDGDCPAASASCAEARCDRGNCTLAPIAAACATSEYCDPAIGCRARGVDVDAGPTSDAGPRLDAPVDVGAGGCSAGCDDGNRCTDDACTAGSCTHTPNSQDCSDGDSCTHSDRCSGGSCSGTGYSCSPPPCMTSSCDGSGGCSVGGGCGGGSVCDGSGCVACGGADQRCCDAGGCNSGLWCFTGVCTCGQPGGPCCPWDGSCAAGTCAGGTCPTCLPDGAGCSGVPLSCCGTSRCTSGICFPF